MKIIIDGDAADEEAARVFNNPFSRQFVQAIYISVYKTECRASIVYVHGKTSGQQDLSGYTDFTKLLHDINTFIETLK